MAAKLIILHHQPRDRTAFDTYYKQTHVPLAKRQPGICSFTANAGAIASPTGESPYYILAELTFDTLDDLQIAANSVEGQAAAADLTNFAYNGATILVYEMRDV